MVRHGVLGQMFALIGFLLLAIPLAGAATTPCADGTGYFKCSTTQVGYACLPDSSSGSNSLQLYIIDPQGKPTKCACANFPGYVTQNGQCVKAVCTVGSDTIQNGQCYAKTFQKCVNGQLIEDPTCGCPAGKKPSTDNKICIDKTEGCRWTGSVKCLNYQNCTFDAANPSDDGTCAIKSGCQYAQYNNQNCNSAYETCNTATGKCDKAAGKCAGNSDCTGGNICNTITHTCEAKPSDVVTGGSATPLLGGNEAAPSTQAENGASRGTFCCLPISIGMAGVGLALVRKKEEN